MRGGHEQIGETGAVEARALWSCLAAVIYLCVGVRT